MVSKFWTEGLSSSGFGVNGGYLGQGDVVSMGLVFFC